MKNKKLKKIVIAIVFIIIISGVSVYATYNYYASQVSYDKDGTEVSVAEALNDLYAKSQITNYEELKESLLNDISTQILDKTYPVGSIYISTENKNPGELLGGTWKPYAQGKTLVGVDANDDDFKENKTGGEKAHTLTVDELPTNIGSFRALRWTDTSLDGSEGAFSFGQTTTNMTLTGGASLNTGTARYTLSGGGNAHNNLQPYITVYMWKRTI